MRWRLSLFAPVLLLLFQATESRAQQEVAITVTIPATNHAITQIAFPPYTTRGPIPTPDTRRQFKVGVGQYNEGDERFELTAKYFVGGSPNPFVETFSFDTEALCNETDPATGDRLSEGELARISCSVVERGVAGGIVCSAIYEDMINLAMVPDTCTGTVACLRCGQMKVCGSNPQCY